MSSPFTRGRSYTYARPGSVSGVRTLFADLTDSGSFLPDRRGRSGGAVPHRGLCSSTRHGGPGAGVRVRPGTPLAGGHEPRGGGRGVSTARTVPGQVSEYAAGRGWGGGSGPDLGRGSGVVPSPVLSSSSLVSTNEHLLQELSRVRAQHEVEVEQLHWSYQELKKTLALFPHGRIGH